MQLVRRYETAFRLGDTTVLPDRNLLVRAGMHFRVERQVMVVLIHLVERVDEVVPRDELLEKLWVGSVPNSNGLTQCISKLRAAFGDSPSKSARIETIRKVGYRLIGPVELVDKTSATEPTTAVAARLLPQRRERVSPFYLAVALHGLIAAVFLTMVFANLQAPAPSDITVDLEDHAGSARSTADPAVDPFGDFFTSFMVDDASTE